MMAEGGDTRSGSELVFDFFCELCIDDNKHVEAEGYCVDCRDYLCGTCYRGHRRSRPTWGHVLQDRSDMPKDTPLSTSRVSTYVTTKCNVHSGKHVEYYCKTHSVLGCANCFATDHRKCADVESVAQKSENILESQWYKEFISNLQMIRTKSRDIAERACENRTVSQRCCADVVSMVRQLKEEAIAMLNDLEESTVTLAEKMMSEDEERIESVAKDCTLLSQKIEKVASEFETLQSSKRVCQLYINMRERVSEVNTLRENIGKLEKANVVRTFTFEPNAGLTSLLRNPDILGTITHQLQQVRKQIPVATRDPGSMTEGNVKVRTPSPVTTVNPLSFTAKESKDIHVRSSSDLNKCFITGSVVLSNNRLIITDADNNKVKLVDTHTNKVLSELKLSSKPLDITVCNKTQAVVTLPGNNKILVMKVSPSLTQEKEIVVRGACRGIAYSQDKLLVTFKDRPRLELIDLSGNVIRTIEIDSDGSKLFACPGYVCVSSDDGTIYVTDRDRDKMTSLTRDGVVKAVFKDEELNSPGKVCTDHNNNVYICGIRSKNVHMVMANCKKSKVILTKADGLHSDVWSVSHCQDTNRLFIGMAGDVVKVFQLS